MSYNFDDIAAAYRAVGVTPGRTVYVTSNLVRLMAFESRDRKAVLNAHFRALFDLLGPDGTLVVPAATLNLCNTDIPFDLSQTRSDSVGVFSEYVRTLPDTQRSFHPFVSYCAIGARAEKITAEASPHAFGPETPEARMIELDSLNISIGLEPRHTCSTVHHVEQMVGVPYRYTKEFVHPVMRDNRVLNECFYMYVWYRDCGVQRSNTRWIFEYIDKTDLVTSAPLGEGQVWSYSSQRFFKIVSQLMAKDPYIWCQQPPEKRPWRN